MHMRKSIKSGTRIIDLSLVQRLKQLGLSDAQIENHDRTPQAPSTPLSMSLPFCRRVPFREQQRSE